MNIANTMAFWNQGIIALAAVMLTLAAFWDAKQFRIPNVFPLALLVLFPAYVLTSSRPVVWGQHLLVAGIVLVAGYFLYAKKLTGAGDVKLLSAASLWAGPEWIWVLLFVMAIAGGALASAFACMAYLRRGKTKGSGAVPVAKTPVPYGVAIAIGGLCTLLLLFQPLPPS